MTVGVAQEVTAARRLSHMRTFAGGSRNLIGPDRTFHVVAVWTTHFQRTCDHGCSETHVHLNRLQIAEFHEAEFFFRN